MTTKTINTTINGGYVLSNSYSVLTITGAGTINGAFPQGVGLTVPFAAQTYNGGVIAGAGPAPHKAGTIPQGYPGGDGADLAGGTFSNSGSVRGAAAGPGYGFPPGSGGQVSGAAGGAGGVGIALSAAGAVINTGVIEGGNGGAGGAGASGYHNYTYYPGFGGAGGTGGAGVYLAAGGQVTNTGQIIGGAGGVGGVGSSAAYNGSAGPNGAGVLLKDGGAVTNGSALATSALISGGVAARGAAATIANFGVIAGAKYDYGYVYGVDLEAGGRVTNGSSVVASALISYGINFGAAAGATLINFGTVSGGVFFGSGGDRLIAEAGSTLTGGVFCNAGGTLELVSGAETITSLGVNAAITGSVTMNASYFSTYLIDTADSATFTGVNRLRGGHSLIGQGTIGLAAGATLNVNDGAVVQARGALINAGTVALASSTASTDLRILAAGATLSGGGTVTMSGPKARILGVSAATKLTNVDNTIAGTGFIGAGQLTLTNEAAGVIDASTKGQLVVKTSGAALTNAGLMEATGGGLLVITQTTVGNVGGTIEAASGSVVDLSDDVIQGGTLGMAGGGPIDVNVAGGGLDGTTHAVTVAGLVQLLAGKTLILDGAIVNSGRLNTYAGSSTADLIVGAAGATLSGKGSVNLSNSLGNRIYGLTAADVLTNVDNHIDGAGLLGKGVLTLVNDAAGQIIGNQNLSLTIDTGANTITNAGLIENVGKGGTLVKSAVNNTGSLVEATAGTLTLAGKVTGTGVAKVSGGTLYVEQAFAENVAFTGTTGVLKLGDSQAYTGKVTGLSATGTNSLDLADIGYFSATTKASFSGTTASGVLTVTDGTHTAKITLIGNYTGSTFTVSSDGHGGTKVVDPAAAPATAPFVAAMAAFGSHGAAVAVAVEPWRGTVAALAAPRPHPA